MEVTDSADGVKTSRTFFVRVALPRGHLLARGDNSHGQAEIPASLLPPRRIHAIAAGGAHNLVISEGVVVAWGDNAAGQCAVPAWGDLKAFSVAAGASHSLALLTDGSVRGWGDNAAGQCVVPSNLGPVKAIAAGAAHSLALLQDGTVVGWGENASGQLNAPVFVSPVAALAAGHDHSLALLKNGTVVAWGANDLGQCAIPVGLRNIASVGAAGDASFAVTKSGKVYAWGDTSFGQAPSPAKLKPVTYASGGWDFIAARLGTGGLAFWGASATDLANAATGMGKIQALAAGGGHVLVIRDGATDAKPRVINELTKPSTTAWDEPAEISVTATGAMLTYQWYFNNQPIPGATQATYRIDGMRLEHAGFYSVRVFNGFTENAYISYNTNLPPPSLPSFDLQRLTPGRQAARLGDRIRIEIAGEGAGRLSYAWRHDGVLLPGENSAVLERVITDAAQAGRYVVEVRDEAHRLATPVTFVDVGPATARRIVAWGSGELGQLDVPDRVVDAVKVAAGAAHTLALRADGTVLAWGDDRAGQSTVPEGLRDVVDVAARGNRSAALCADGSVVVWGGGAAALTIRTGRIDAVGLALSAEGVYVLSAKPESWGLAGVAATIIEPPERYYGLNTFYTLDATGTLSAVTDLGSATIPWPVPGLSARSAKSVSVSSSVSTSFSSFSVSANTGWFTYSYPPLPNQKGYLFDPLSRDLVDFAAYGRWTAVLDRAGTAGIWRTDYFNPDGYSGVYSYASWMDLAPIGQVAAGDGYALLVGADGLIGGIGTNPTVFQRAPYRVRNIRSITAGGTHVVALVEGDAPAAPRILNQSGSRAAAAGESVRLRVRAEGTDLRFQWSRDGEQLPGATAATLDLGAFTPDMVGVYVARATDGFASVESEPITLSLGEAPEFSQAPARRVGLRVGERLELTAQMIGDGPFVFRWLRNGLELGGETGPSLVREAVALEDAGRYTLIVTGAEGVTRRATSHVFVLSEYGTRLVDENDIIRPVTFARPWAQLRDAVKFDPSGLSLRLDGTVQAWGGDAIQSADRLAWVAGLRDVVDLSRHAVLGSDGRLSVMPGMMIPAELLARDDIVALIPGYGLGVLLDDGRTGVWSGVGTTVSWLPSVGEPVDVRAVSLNLSPEPYLGSSGTIYVPESTVAVLGSDGVLGGNLPAGFLTFPEILNARRILPDAEGGLSVIDAAGEVHAGAHLARSRTSDPDLSQLADATISLVRKVWLHRDGSVSAWKRNGSSDSEWIALPDQPYWRRGVLQAGVREDRVMVLRSGDSLPSVRFSRARMVFSAGEPVVLEPVVHGRGELVYTWERNGAKLVSATGPRMELPAGDARNAGWYRLRATDADGLFDEQVVYVQIQALGAHIKALPGTISAKVPPLSDVVDVAPGIAIRADGSVAMWDAYTGEPYGVVPEVVHDVVSVTAPGIALDASGVLTEWDPLTGTIVRRIENVLWLRSADRAPGFAIMRDGTVRSLSTGALLYGTEIWHREIVDVRSAQVWRYTQLCLVRRDGTVAYFASGRGVQFISAETLGGTILDTRVGFEAGMEFLVETATGDIRLANALGVGPSTELRTFDRASQSSLGIDSSHQLLGANAAILGEKVHALWSPWILTESESDVP